MTSKNQFYDEEYQPSQYEDYSAQVQPESEQIIADAVEDKPLINDAPPSSTGLTPLWNEHKRMIIVVGVVILVAIVFAFLRILYKPARVVSIAPAPAPTVVSQPIVDPQVLAQLASLKEDAAHNADVVRQLQGQVQQLASGLSQSRADQQQLSQNVMVLVSQMQRLSAQIQILTQPKPAKASAPAPKAAPVPVVTFQLRAVVPGRAWIVSSDGRSQSVTVGDPIQQYGVVQSIDADAGVVITTSGKTIKF